MQDTYRQDIFLLFSLQSEEGAGLGRCNRA